ncbi:MAG: RNA polymerase factor sigma-54 [Candidatus Hydrothermales bacterium]
MKEKIKIKQEISLKPVLLPRLVQIAKLYSLNLLELREYLNNELENNFILEKKEKKLSEVESEREDFELKEFFQVFSETEYYESKEVYEEEEDSLSSIPSKGPSLYERLIYQIEFAFKDKREKELALRLIDYINKDGYVEVDIKEISKELNVNVEEIENVRKRMLQLDPVGVAAVDLREALLAQLEVRKMENTLAYQIVRDYFDKLKESKQELLNILNKKREEIEEALILIKKLNFKPGAIYSEENPEYVVPEYVIKLRNGDIVIEEIKGLLPQIRLNKCYLKLLEKENTPSDVKKFIKDYVRKAKTFFELLSERKRKIEEVLNFIVNFQREFITSFEGKLKPISQSEAARRLNLSVSALHRIITGKYVATPRGIFELKFFFPRGLRTKKGKTVDREDLKNFIKDLIEKETINSPLTDSKIREIIKAKKGIEITRREVCKLRKELGIESSIKRKLKSV